MNMHKRKQHNMTSELSSAEGLHIEAAVLGGHDTAIDVLACLLDRARTLQTASPCCAGARWA